MKSNEFITEELQHPEASQFIAENPFTESLIRLPVYHATSTKFERFERAAHGVFVSQHYDYAALHYGSDVIPLYVDVRKPFNGDHYDPYIDAAFARDYETLAKWLDKFKAEGYDCAAMYGDGNSLILIGDVPMVHAITGKGM